MFGYFSIIDHSSWLDNAFSDIPDGIKQLLHVLTAVNMRNKPYLIISLCFFLFFFLFLSFYSFYFSLFFLPSPTLRLLVNLFVLLTLETLGTLGLWYEELVFWRNWCSEKKVVVSWVCCRHSLHWVQNMVFWITSYSCKHCY